MASTTTSISVQRYTIGWIAALSIELAAATAMLDVEHRKPTDFQQRSDDSNYYTWGSIGSHNVVIACLVGGRYGTVSAATTALTMRSSLPHLKVCFMVGIGAGVPQGQSDIDIRLGDVVVSHPSGSSPGVIQYNIGKVKADGVFERTGSLRSSPDALLNAITKLRAQHHIKRRSKIGPILEEMYVRHPEMKEIDEDGGAGFVHQGTVRDRLFQADYLHAASESKKSGQDDELSSCFACDSAYEVERSTRKNVVPRIHYGTIASGDCVIRDAITRDQVVAALGCPCLCFEMEAAGLMNAFPCIVIRGICDYADTHKNDNWQPYAAATAAAYAKELVLILDHQDVDNTPSLQVVADSFVRQIEAAMQPLHASIKEIGSTIEVGRNNSPLDCLQVAHDATFDSHVEQTKARCLANTRVDILDMIHRWTDDEAGRTIFWLNGPAGCGKSTVSRTVARALHSKQRLAASFFFKRGEGSRSLATRFFPTLARQLATFPELGEHIVRACRDDPQVGAGALVDQFQALISDPLTHSKVPMSRADALIIVVDALDECSHEDDLRTILELFERFKKQTRLRLFVTSRPELPITLQFSRMSSDLFHDVDLHSATVGKIEDDIRVLLKHEFAWRARAPEQQWNDLNGTKPWPDLPTIEKLAQIANPLFIIAATIVRYVWESPENPRIRLDHLLHNWASKTSSQMELMYLPVLQQLSTKHSDQGHILSQFRSLMGAIVVLLEPMSRNSLEVLGFGEQMHILQSLRSVLEVPKDPDKPIRFLHLSFRDFLISRRGMNDPCPAVLQVFAETYVR
ncbi:Hypothetical protein D9617_47g010850 [Elsinoe fawcettii]|nr:Hypothetical protein D9617_47g010850 [Elsinoe fawcettii]